MANIEEAKACIVGKTVAVIQCFKDETIDAAMVYLRSSLNKYFLLFSFIIVDDHDSKVNLIKNGLGLKGANTNMHTFLVQPQCLKKHLFKKEISRVFSSKNKRPISIICSLKAIALC